MKCKCEVPELQVSALSTGARVDLLAVLSLTDEVPQVTDTVTAVLGLGGFLVFRLGHPQYLVVTETLKHPQVQLCPGDALSLVWDCNPS